MTEELKHIYRCGWCGHPTDINGECIKENPDEYLSQNKDAIVTDVDGECCPGGDQRTWLSEWPFE